MDFDTNKDCLDNLDLRSVELRAMYWMRCGNITLTKIKDCLTSIMYSNCFLEVGFCELLAILFQCNILVWEYHQLNKRYEIFESGEGKHLYITGPNAKNLNIVFHLNGNENGTKLKHFEFLAVQTQINIQWSENTPPPPPIITSDNKLMSTILNSLIGSNYKLSSLDCHICNKSIGLLQTKICEICELKAHSKCLKSQDPPICMKCQHLNDAMKMTDDKSNQLDENDRDHLYDDDDIFFSMAKLTFTKWQKMDYMIKLIAKL